MGDRVVGLCNFCEVHGPRVVFVCQETSGVNGQRRIRNKVFYGDVSLDLLGSYSIVSDEPSTVTSSETCDGCRSSSTSKPAFLSSDHENRISYIGCQYPYRVDVFSRVRCACVRSLSCEACPGRQGPIVFGDSVNGFCLCYVFTLKDSKARGFQHSYSIVVVSRQLDELIRNYSSLVSSLKTIVTQLQLWSDRVFDRERAESIDRMPQIAASGRAGWVPSGFFLRSAADGGGTRRAIGAPRSLMELTDRADIFRSLHEMFVDIHRVAAINEIYGLRTIGCSRGSGEDGDILSIDDGDGLKSIGIEKNGGYCHICAACTATSASPRSFAFQTLTILYDILGSEAFSMLVYHLLIGNQIVVRSSCICSNRVLLDALKLLLPSRCIKCVDSSREYRESWECNLVGLLIDNASLASAHDGEEGRSIYSKLASASDSFQSLSSSAGEDGCVILSMESNPTEFRNGNLDYSSCLIPSGLIKNRNKALPRDGYHFRVCCTAAASTNSYFDAESPALLQSILNLLSTTFTRCFMSEEGVEAGLAVLDTLKDEWLSKAKLYYVMSKKCQGEDDSWRQAFFRLSKCSAIDEPILKFWRSGLSRQFKQSVLCQYSSQRYSQHAETPKAMEARVRNVFGASEMHIFWESTNWPGARIDPAFTWLSWTDCNGASSSSSSAIEGLLAAGNQSGTVGITRTGFPASSLSENTNHPAPRFNFNLRGHRSPVCRVEWNRQFQKLASCDEAGVVYIWVRHEDRWSVELVNERNVRVNDLCWNVDGSLALICYLDNFVLVGSAAGQRVWSQTYEQKMLCGCWMPEQLYNRNSVLLGDGDGSCWIVGENGTTIREHCILRGKSIRLMAWSSYKENGAKPALAMVLGEDMLYFMDDCDDADPRIRTLDVDIQQMRWSINERYLALIGHRESVGSWLFIYDAEGNCLRRECVSQAGEPNVNGLAWAYDDQVIFISVGGLLRVGRLYWDIPSLRLLSSRMVWRSLVDEMESADDLPLPAQEKVMIRSHSTHVLRCSIPSGKDVCRAVCKPTPYRYFCTIRPSPNHLNQSPFWELCYEHAGGLVPVLGGQLTNKLRPEFEIWLHFPENSRRSQREVSASPPLTPKFARGGLQRDSVWRRSKRQIQAIVSRQSQSPQALTPRDAKRKLVLVTSNVWCTRFKMIGLDTSLLPLYVGQVMYKTSVLHLQPRQMTVHLVDLSTCAPSIDSTIGPLPSNEPDPSEANPVDENLLSSHGGDDGPVVAPLPAELFAGLTNAGNLAFGNSRASSDTYQDACAIEEKALERLMDEFAELKSAVDGHMQKMRAFATALKDIDAVVDNSAKPQEVPSTQASKAVAVANAASASLPSDWWTSVNDELDYIDADEVASLVENAEKRAANAEPAPSLAVPVLLNPVQTTGAAFDRPDTNTFCGVSGKKQLREVSTLVDRLYKLAIELANRRNQGTSAVAQAASSKSSSSPSRRAAVSSERPVPSAALCQRLREVSGRVVQLESRISYGNDLLDEVRNDLLNRVVRIRSILDPSTNNNSGVCSNNNVHRPTDSVKSSDAVNAAAPTATASTENATAGGEGEVLILNNKTPFWNEVAQVYQLDFGGRVTQESAKNFQIEHRNKQVMQFGRIENGGYTLDFESPFAPVQAFAIALASITQRLK